MIPNYQWNWNGKFIPIKDLHETQLKSINKTLVKNKGTTWFNIESSDWRVLIKEELERRVLMKNKDFKRINNAAKGILTQFNEYKSLLTWKK